MDKKKPSKLICSKSGELIWDLVEDSPELVHLLPLSVRELLETIRRTGTTSVASTAAPFDAASFFRPERHVRAFYERVKEGADRRDAVVAYKGSEVWCNDLGRLINEMSQGRTCLNKTDFFIMIEGKAPLVYLTHEALSDARKATALFHAVLSTFDCHPTLPLPLCVIKWPPEAIRRYRRIVFPHLSEAAREIVDRDLRDGLAEYVYFYPGPPHRLRHSDHDAWSLLQDMAETVHRIDSWVTLFTQMLCSGYFPCVLSNQKWGCCIQDQNVCMNGGFVDVDSVQPIDTDPSMFGPNLLASVQMLAHSIFVFLRPLLRPEMSDRGVLQIGNVFGTSLHQILFFPHVWRMVEIKIGHFLASGIQIDKRLVEVFSFEPSVEGLTQKLMDLQPLAQHKTDVEIQKHTRV